MPYLLNLLYLALLLFASPGLTYKALTTGKYRKGMWRKFWGLTPIRLGARPCAWFHAVSVGEVLLLRQVIARFRQRHPDWECVLSTTTNTGFDVAQANYPDLTIFYWPLDFTWAVRRALRRIRPDLVVLAELELWPNFIAMAKKQRSQVAVINGRISLRSFRGYGKIRPFMSHMLSRLDLLAVQGDAYANGLLQLGAPRDRIKVTGSVKYDGVPGDRGNLKTQELAQLLGLGGSGVDAGRNPLVWVAGSTQDPEEEIVLEIYERAKKAFPELRLILVPRHKERFEAVAARLGVRGFSFVRRSRLTEPLRDPEAVVLVDTLGELGAIWGLADIAFVGGSLNQRGGQNMIEPAAYGAAVLFGPHVWNFRETVDRLLDQQAAVQVQDAARLEQEVFRLLADEEVRTKLGTAAQRFVRSQAGASERTIELLEQLIAGRVESRAA